MNIILILSIVILLISFFYTKNKLKEIKEQQSKTGLEIWEQEKEKYKVEKEAYEREKAEREREKVNKQLEYDAFFAKQREICRGYELEKNKLENEIQTKTNFNNSLLQIREEELNRLIEEKKKEKEKTLEEQLKLKQAERTEILNAEFTEFSARQEEIKSNILAELKQIQDELEDFRLQREAINQAILREKEIQEKETFYKLDISENDKEDMLILRSIAPQLKNREALNKLIYEVFIRRPLSELIKRITGSRAISGIYKITYIKTGEAYIGRTTDIQTRWQNHIKTACGLEGAARSTLHSRLEKDGIWNYTFEILEEVPKEKLSEREKFYIDLYETDKQLNMRKGS